MYRGWKSYRIWDQKLSAVVAFALVFLFNLFIRDAPVNFSRKKIRRRVLWPRIKRFLFYGYRNIYIYMYPYLLLEKKQEGKIEERRRYDNVRFFFKFKKKKRYGRILAVLLIKTSILYNIFFSFFFFLNSIFFYTRILHIFQSQNSKLYLPFKEIVTCNYITVKLS